MRGALGVLLLVAAPAAAAKVTFGKAPVPVGLEVATTGRLTLSLDLTMEMAGETHPLETGRSEVETLRAKALTVSGDTVTGYAVTWSENRQESTGIGAELDDGSEVVGVPFVVESNGSRRADGQELTEAQAAALGEAANPFHDVTSLSADVAGKTVKVGKAISAASVLSPEMLQVADGTQTEVDGQLILREVTREAGAEVAVFTLTLSASMRQAQPTGSMDMNMRLEGEMRVDVATGWLHSVDLSGPMNMNATSDDDGQPMKMAGSGRFVLAQAHSYTRP